MDLKASQGMVIAMRHGETEWNAKGFGAGGDVEILRGSIDVPLDVAGVEHVHERALEILDRYPVVEVRSTPHFLRAAQTRHIVAQVCSVPEVDAPEFAPWDPGALSGKPVALIAELLELLIDVPFLPAPGGGSFGDYAQNFTQAWQRVYAEFGQDDSRAVVLILFGNDFRVLPSITEGKPLERYATQKVKPGDFVAVH